MDHVLRYQDTPGVKMIVMLGEVIAAPKCSLLSYRFYLNLYVCKKLLFSTLTSFTLILRLEALRSTGSAKASERAG